MDSTEKIKEEFEYYLSNIVRSSKTTKKDSTYKKTQLISI